MSAEWVAWAWAQEQVKDTDLLVLLALADEVGPDGVCEYSETTVRRLAHKARIKVTMVWLYMLSLERAMVLTIHDESGEIVLRKGTGDEQAAAG